MGRALSAIFSAIERMTVRYRRIVITLVHLLLAVLANYLAFLLRFEGIIPEEHIDDMLTYLPYLVVIRLAFFIHAGLYRDLWRYASMSDLTRILSSVTLGSVAFYLVVRTYMGDTSYPRSIYVLDWLLMVIFSGGARFMVRVFKEYLEKDYGGSRRRLLVIGAGDAGEMIVRDMRNNPQYNYDPVGFLDDDPYKAGRAIHGVPIIGQLDALPDAVRRTSAEEILIAIPSADNRTVRKIFDACKPFKLPVKILPALGDILEGKVSVSQIKPLSLEDLLHREPVRTDNRNVRELISGRRVLVTGAGGSIGSELCRQIAAYGPSLLVILDRYENGLFEVGLELGRRFPSLKVVSAIGDVTDRGSMDYLFKTHKPEVVFHAAAHKHVPLMEGNPLEAVKNNVFGTRTVIEAAIANNVGRFVMISTDKAVNPMNVMGATKRIAEFLALRAGGATKFTTVRFGNVLGSSGSVFHVFKEQISRGGPVTVTHPDITRYFMLIPEAVQLVLLAASHGQGGEIFVLDMGEPIRIAEFAENMIMLSGLVPHEDVEITYTGLRPGEKLFEELFDQTERRLQTPIEKVMTAEAAAPSEAAMSALLAELESAVRSHDPSAATDAIARAVPGFRKRDAR